ncbi:CPBP family intramembrane glutamic endopeptidase [Marinicauda pacifica]|uniref:CPBP family intramembrane glutamic endopeptidase n=1 Tax=Marinicauda pacifica TaxID=1133559 RepID=UPI0035C7D4BA
MSEHLPAFETADSPARTALYAPWPPNARRSWGAGAIALVVGFYLVATIAMVVGQIAWTVSAHGAGVFSDPQAMTAALSDLPPPVIFFPLMLVLFLTWGGLSLAWVSGFERRGLSTIGFRAERAGRLFVNGAGLAIAAIIALSVTGLLIGLMAPVDVTEAAETADWWRLADPTVWLVIGGLAAFFFIQGGVEEIVFRGWLMSTLSARWGRIAGVGVTALVFALFHLQVFMSGFYMGLAALAGISMTGLFLGLLALRQGSLWGVIGLHGAFNAVSVIGPVSYMIASQPEATIGEAVSRVFEQATGMAASSGFQPQILAQALVFGTFSLFMLWRLTRTRRQAR